MRTCCLGVAWILTYTAMFRLVCRFSRNHIFGTMNTRRAWPPVFIHRREGFGCMIGPSSIMFGSCSFFDWWELVPVDFVHSFKSINWIKECEGIKMNRCTCGKNVCIRVFECLEDVTVASSMSQSQVLWCRSTT